VYDSTDLVIPPVENGAMFITTALVPTPQERGQCVSTQQCTSDEDCKNQLTSNGIILPTCNTTASNTTGYCMIEGWCPLEQDDASHTTIINGIEDITIFLRSSVKYNLFNIIMSDSTDAILGKNLFTVQSLLGDRNISECTTTGCIISVGIDWTCNLDGNDCNPKFTFMSSPGGFNFRTIDYSLDRTQRLLQKMYGIRLLVTISGTGGKFSFFRMMITIGSGAAFLTLATVITDYILLFLFSKRHSFEQQKWDHFSLKDKEDISENPYLRQE